MVVTIPNERNTFTYLRVEAERMHFEKSLDCINVRGLVLVRTDPEKRFDYRYKVVVRDDLETPPEGRASS